VAAYDPSGYGKHKHPGGWGSVCPDEACLGAPPQVLLDTGGRVERLICDVAGDFALCAQERRPGAWRGYPIPWSRLPPQARDALIAAGRLDLSTYRKTLRRNWGSEFAR